MASKKGILLTAAIAAAVVGSSFLIYFIPHNGGNLLANRTFQDTYSEVYTKSNETSGQADSIYADWRSNKTTTQEALSKIADAQAQAAQLKQELSQANPPAEWQSAFSKYSGALDNFAKYLDAVRGAIANGKMEHDSSVDQARQEWLDSVDQSVKAIPVS